MTTQQPNVQTREGQEQMKKMGIKPIPTPDDLTRPYWEAAKRQELSIRRCKACGQYNHPPVLRDGKDVCLKCGAADFEWTRVSGKGRVYTFVIDRRLMVPGFDEPFVIAQVIPAEAQDDMVRITANIKECELEDVYVGMPVEVFYEQRTPEVTLPQFKPSPEAKLKSKGG